MAISYYQIIPTWRMKGMATYLRPAKKVKASLHKRIHQFYKGHVIASHLKIWNVGLMTLNTSSMGGNPCKIKDKKNLYKK